MEEIDILVTVVPISFVCWMICLLFPKSTLTKRINLVYDKIYDVVVVAAIISCLFCWV